MTTQDEEKATLSDLAPGIVGEEMIGMEAHDGEFTVESRTQWQLIRRRFFRHRLAMVSLTVLVAMVILAYVGLPLDHALYRGSITVPSRRVGPDLGPAHRPLLFDVSPAAE